MANNNIFNDERFLEVLNFETSWVDYSPKQCKRLSDYIEAHVVLQKFDDKMYQTTDHFKAFFSQPNNSSYSDEERELWKPKWNYRDKNNESPGVLERLFGFLIK